MAKLNQRDRAAVNKAKVEALTAYLEMCNRIKEVPRTDIISLLKTSLDPEALREAATNFISTNL